MILFGPCTTTKMTKKRDAETAPEDEPSGSKPAIESAVETSERPKYQAPSCRIWQHPTADATLFEFDLRNIQPLIEAALESTDGHLKVHPKILVFGNEAHMRRSVGFFANPKDTYGYFFSRQLFASVMPSQPMQRLINLVSELLGSEVNGVLVNHYADGSEYISPHSDDESGIGDAGVFCISVGAERRFELTSKDKHIPTPKFVIPTREFHAILMAGKEFQSTTMHAIPKQASVKTARCSLTFRKHNKAAEKARYRAHMARGGIVN